MFNKITEKLSKQSIKNFHLNYFDEIDPNDPNDQNDLCKTCSISTNLNHSIGCVSLTFEKQNNQPHSNSFSYLQNKNILIMFDQPNDNDGNGNGNGNRNGNGNENENGVKIVLFESMRQRHQLNHKHQVKQVQNKTKKHQQQLTFKFEQQPQQRYLNFNCRRIYQNLYPWILDRRELLNINYFNTRRVNNNMIVNEMIDTNSLIIVLIVNANSVERFDGFNEFSFVKKFEYDSIAATTAAGSITNPVTDFSKSTMKIITENNAKQFDSITNRAKNVLVSSERRASLKSTKQQKQQQQQHKHRSPKKPQNIKLKMSQFLKILFQYAMLFNCLTQLVSGNLMTRNVGNDIGNDHNNQSAMNLNNPNQNQNQTTSMANRLSMTTATPNILSPNVTNNMMGSVKQQSGDSGDDQRQQHYKYQQYQDTLGFAADESSNPNEESGEEYSRCPSCQFREQLKAHNLASIKMHILHRLLMEKPPNITGRPHISEEILQQFYQTKDFRYIRIRNNSFDDSSDEMQGDDPTANHQHHYIHGGKSGLQPHHHHQTSYHGHHHVSRSGRNNSSAAGGNGNGAGGSSGNSKKNSGGSSNNKFGSDSEYNEDDDYNLNERGGISYNMDYYDEPRTPSRSHYADMDQSDEDSDEEAFYSMTDVIYSFPRRK